MSCLAAHRTRFARVMLGAALLASSGALAAPSHGADVAAGDILMARNGVLYRYRSGLGETAVYPPAAALGFSLLTAIAAGADGDIFFYDPLLSRLFIYDATTRAPTTLAIVGGLTDMIDAPAQNAIFATRQSVNEVIKIDAASGAQTNVSSGGLISGPTAIALGPDGQIYVTASLSNSVVRIDPATGGQSAAATGLASFAASGLAFSPQGALYATGTTVQRVDLQTGTAQTITSGGMLLGGPNRAVVLSDGDILVASAGYVRIDPDTGGQSAALTQHGGGSAGIALDVAGRVLRGRTPLFGFAQIDALALPDGEAETLVSTLPPGSEPDLAVDASGRIYATQYSQDVTEYFPAANVTKTVFADPAFAWGVAIGSGNSVFLGLGSEVHRINPNSGAAELLFTIPEPPPNGRYAGLAVGLDGDVYVGAESIGDGQTQGQVIRWDAATGAVTLFVAQTCQSVGGVCAIAGLARVADGSIIVSDFTDDRLVRFDPTSGAILQTIAAFDPVDIAAGPGNSVIASLGGGWGFSGGVFIVDLATATGVRIGAAARAVAHVPATAAGSAQLFSAVLPSGRSTQVGAAATVFGTVLNLGPQPGLGCLIDLPSWVDATVMFQTTDPATNTLVGEPNLRIDIAPGGLQSFLIAATPTEAFAPVDVPVEFLCSNSAPAPVFNEVNSLLLSATSDPRPDVIALAATPTQNGILELSGQPSIGGFAIAAANVGIAGDIAVSVDLGGADLPVALSLCETDALTGACTNPTTPVAGPITTAIAAGGTATFSVFAVGSGEIAFDPANSRVYVRFLDDLGVVRGRTSVAVRSAAP